MKPGVRLRITGKYVWVCSSMKASHVNDVIHLSGKNIPEKVVVTRREWNIDESPPILTLHCAVEEG